MSKRAVRGKTTYQTRWETIYPWVTADSKDIYSARCKLCRKSFLISSMGQQALQSHSDGKKHKQHADVVKKSLPISYFQPEVPTTELKTINDDVVTHKSSQQQVIDLHLHKESTTRAEILWCLETVLTHNSLRNAASATYLFKRMFPDSRIAQDMQLQKTKLSYLTVYGLAPHFTNELKSNVKDCKFYVIGFDESMNKISQKQQMDLMIRFWDDTVKEVRSRYFTSMFLYNCTAEDLLKAFTTAFHGFDFKKILQISMDGPNVNVKFLRLLKDYIGVNNDKNTPVFLDIGSCGLHTCHGSFKSGIEGTGWKLSSFLKSLYFLFKDSPARRGEFIRITGSSKLPFKFLNIKWLENVPVAQRAIDVLPNIIKFIEHNKTKPKKDQISSKSFQIVAEMVQDNLLPAKLAFFETLGNEIQPFLTEFQTDAPLAPYLFTSLSLMVKNAMLRFVKKEVLESEALQKIDVMDNKNLLPAKEIDLGYDTRKVLSKCKNVTQKDILFFRQDSRTCLQLFAQKLMERSPLKYPMTKNLICLNPEVIASEKGGMKYLKLTLEKLVNSNLMTGKIADCVQKEYSEFCSFEHVKEEMRSYSRSQSRLDCFWMQILDVNHSKWENLRNFVQMILTLSHGNSFLERGFSVNKETIVVNQTESSLIAQRMIFDAVNSKGGIENVEITKQMIHAARNSHEKYMEALKSEKIIKDQQSKKEEEKKVMLIEVKELESKKKKLDEERVLLATEIQNKKMNLKKI